MMFTLTWLSNTQFYHFFPLSGHVTAAVNQGMDLRFLDVSEDFQRVELGDSKVPFPSEADRHVSQVGIIDGLFSTYFVIGIITALLKMPKKLAITMRWFSGQAWWTWYVLSLVPFGFKKHSGCTPWRLTWNIIMEVWKIIENANMWQGWHQHGGCDHLDW